MRKTTTLSPAKYQVIQAEFSMGGKLPGSPNGSPGHYRAECPAVCGGDLADTPTQASTAMMKQTAVMSVPWCTEKEETRWLTEGHGPRHARGHYTEANIRQTQSQRLSCGTSGL